MQSRDDTPVGGGHDERERGRGLVVAHSTPFVKSQGIITCRRIVSVLRPSGKTRMQVSTARQVTGSCDWEIRIPRTGDKIPPESAAARLLFPSLAEVPIGAAPLSEKAQSRPLRSR
jgi:hypothetical protein